MYILDTNYITILERGGFEAQRLLNRLKEIAPTLVATTIINYQEQTTGCLSRIKQARKPEQQLIAYRLFKQQLTNYCKIPVLNFDRKAEQEFRKLKKLHSPKVGTMDLKIAAIALTHQAVVLTRNTRDFDQIENLSVENWL